MPRDFFLLKESTHPKFAKVGISRPAAGIGRKTRNFLFGHLWRQVVQKCLKPLLNASLGSNLPVPIGLTIFFWNTHFEKK